MSHRGFEWALISMASVHTQREYWLAWSPPPPPIGIPSDWGHVRITTGPSSVSVQRGCCCFKELAVVLRFKCSSIYHKGQSEHDIVIPVTAGLQPYSSAEVC